MGDYILIEELELASHLGVPEWERAAAQRLTMTLKLEPRGDFTALGDDLARTVDYAAVAQAAQAIARERPRQLLETLAEELALGILAQFPLHAVELTVRKYILPDTKAVAICLRRES